MSVGVSSLTFSGSKVAFKTAWPLEIIGLSSHALPSLAISSFSSALEALPISIFGVSGLRMNFLEKLPSNGVRTIETNRLRELLVSL